MEDTNAGIFTLAQMEYFSMKALVVEPIAHQLKHWSGVQAQVS
jgi:hypothetical protein